MFFPADGFDVDDSGTTTEPTPDLDFLARLVSSALDMGAYEGIDSCCPGDQNHSGQVEVNDLLAVISTWGPCPSGCIGDIFPDTCIDGTVNINDLLLVVTHWGPCPPQCPDDGGPNSPLTLEDAYDCMELATAMNLEPYSQDWNEFVEKCIESMLED